MKKIKTYNIILSKVFPVKHPKAGEETGFKPKLMAALNNMPCYHKKIHTIRANYELWKKHFEEIERGDAELCIREWTGRSYRSKTKVIARLTSKDGIGLQKLEIVKRKINSLFIWMVYVDGIYFYGERSLYELSSNDGLSFIDWFDWFKNYKLNKPLAVIHFTNFRY